MKWPLLECSVVKCLVGGLLLVLLVLRISAREGSDGISGSVGSGGR